MRTQVAQHEVSGRISCEGPARPFITREPLHSYTEIIIDVWGTRDRVCELSDGCHDNTTKTLIPRRAAKKLLLFVLDNARVRFLLSLGRGLFVLITFSGDTLRIFR